MQVSSALFISSLDVKSLRASRTALLNSSPQLYQKRHIVAASSNAETIFSFNMALKHASEAPRYICNSKTGKCISRDEVNTEELREMQYIAVTQALHDGNNSQADTIIGQFGSKPLVAGLSAELHSPGEIAARSDALRRAYQLHASLDNSTAPSHAASAKQSVNETETPNHPSSMPAEAQVLSAAGSSSAAGGLSDPSSATGSGQAPGPTPHENRAFFQSIRLNLSSDGTLLDPQVTGAGSNGDTGSSTASPDGRLAAAVQHDSLAVKSLNSAAEQPEQLSEPPAAAAHSGAQLPGFVDRQLGYVDPENYTMRVSNRAMRLQKQVIDLYLASPEYQARLQDVCSSPYQRGILVNAGGAKLLTHLVVMLKVRQRGASAFFWQEVCCLLLAYCFFALYGSTAALLPNTTSCLQMSD